MKKKATRRKAPPKRKRATGTFKTTLTRTQLPEALVKIVTGDVDHVRSLLREYVLPVIDRFPMESRSAEMGTEAMRTLSVLCRAAPVTFNNCTTIGNTLAPKKPIWTVETEK